jgi:deoxyribonuclease V
MRDGGVRAVGLLVPAARRVQERLATRVRESNDLVLPPRTVCGLDVSYQGETAIGAAVLLSYPDLKRIGHAVASCKVTVPYIPTFLSFREYPPLSLAYGSLSCKPDVCFVDAHGRSHPRRMGAASHFGVLRDVPTIGVAKGILCGRPRPGDYAWSALVDGEQIIGAEVVTKLGAKPIYVSVGHRVTLETAVQLTQGCTTNHRLPEPIRLAHSLVTEIKRRMTASKCEEKS